jgi:hypothetical protein
MPRTPDNQELKPYQYSKKASDLNGMDLAHAAQAIEGRVTFPDSEFYDVPYVHSDLDVVVRFGNPNGDDTSTSVRHPSGFLGINFQDPQVSLEGRTLVLEGDTGTKIGRVEISKGTVVLKEVTKE